MIRNNKLSGKQKQGQKVLDTIYLKAWTDEVFKKELLEYPKKTLERFFGKKFPNDKEIIVTDQSNADSIYINIPVKPNFEDIELSEEELEIINGSLVEQSMAKMKDNKKN